MKKYRPKISVIIPVFNRKKELLNCLNSLYIQTYFSYIHQIIIVDDNSTFLVKKFLYKKINTQLLKKILFIRNNKNKGPAVSRNIALNKVKGDTILFLDSDDVLEKRFLEKSLEFPKQITMTLMFPKLIVSSFILKVKYSFLAYFRIIVSMYYLLTNKLLPIEYFYITRLSGMLFPIEYLKSFRFDPAYKSAEDWKFVYEVLFKNKKSIKIIPLFLMSYLVHENSETISRSGYFVYYRNLIKEVNKNISNRFGFKLFKIYAKTKD